MLFWVRMKKEREKKGKENMQENVRFFIFLFGD